MASFYELTHEGKNILCLDIADLKISDKQELNRLVQEAKRNIRQQPPKSVLIITNVKETKFDTEIANTIKEYAKHNTPYIKASSLVGVAGWAKIILTAVKTVTGRDFHLADSVEEAKDWLVKQ